MNIRRLALCSLGTALALAGGAHAQQVYRIVGPDGKVTFSDRAPAEGASAAPVGRSTAVPPSPTLPPALRQASQRYPVTLYTSSDCAPCDSARALLTQRGIPFAERTVSSNDDIDALKRLSGDASLPLATIGAQQLKGFSDTEWTRYLDAAGYPKQSQLPPGYRRPAPAPMVAVVPKAAPAEPAAAPGSGEAGGNAPSAPARPAGPAPANPAGIVF
ncbi:glutaredoxin [Melaminivora alkalimesophila]|uniref:Glutaredoxin n=2 Tax=Melaminivora alkalimesophila TaxID=1165852 RepID=A0A317R978_9BURK|nr:glutaredoxin domain-containing protein [Melaminivora alkalimesophila]PWW44695.1 glutaredoxin [Melaminivora alkalimesophila]